MDAWVDAVSICLVSARSGCRRLARASCGVPCRHGAGSCDEPVSSVVVHPALVVDPGGPELGRCRVVLLGSWFQVLAAMSCQTNSSSAPLCKFVWRADESAKVVGSLLEGARGSQVVRAAVSSSIGVWLHRPGGGRLAPLQGGAWVGIVVCTGGIPYTHSCLCGLAGEFQ